MLLQFSKYQGTGNDFIMMDEAQLPQGFDLLAHVPRLCDRKFGVGADGLIVLRKHDSLDFEMDYYNADGSKSFCGNGARCTVAFAKRLGKITDTTRFLAIDGEHEASVNEEIVHLKMNTPSEISTDNEAFVIHTGSPHYIDFDQGTRSCDMKVYGAQVRYNERYRVDGINVNKVEIVAPNQLFMRTYERGVEDETLSCGTGVTAAALVYARKHLSLGRHTIGVETLGGLLSVGFDMSATGFEHVELSGPATQVFDGSITI